MSHLTGPTRMLDSISNLTRRYIHVGIGVFSECTKLRFVPTLHKNRIRNILGLFVVGRYIGLKGNYGMLSKLLTQTTVVGIGAFDGCTRCVQTVSFE